MAKVTMPLMSQEARGKVGSVVFNTWRGIATVKAFKSPAQPGTAAQTSARARLTTCSTAWATITAAQRSAWKTYADAHLETDWTGQPKRLTAQNWYIRCNTRIALVGGAAISDPPAVAAPGQPTGLTIAYVPGPPKKITATWTAPLGATLTLVFYAHGPISAGRTPRWEQAVIVAQKLGNVAKPADLINPASPGEYGVWCQVIDNATGLASVPLEQVVTVS